VLITGVIFIQNVLVGLDMGQVLTNVVIVIHARVETNAATMTPHTFGMTVLHRETTA
jgi:hypothetical protein